MPYSRESAFSGSIVYLLYYIFKGVVEASLYNVGLVQCLYTSKVSLLWVACGYTVGTGIG